MKYDDFVINIESKRDDDCYVINVKSPQGEGDASFTLRHSIDEMLDMFQSVGHTVRGAAAGEDSIVRDAKFVEVKPKASMNVGRDLFKDLFVGTTRSLFDSSLAVSQERGKGLRIKLQIDPADPELAKLASLPWESMVGETKDVYSLQKETPFVRYLNVQRPHEVSKFVPPLKILVVIANPKGTAPLDLAHERSLMEESLGEYPEIEVKFLESPTVSQLNDELSKDYHVLHYMGHGDFDEKSGMGVLLMSDAEGRASPLDGERLGVFLRRTGIRLVFLNACNTAKAAGDGGKDPFGGVATSLVGAGVPAVVAMQFPISDKAAIAFSRKFYNEIVRGHPVDAAVATSRMDVFAADASNLEWATPVLFMRAPDGMLFDMSDKPGKKEQRSEEPEPVIEPKPIWKIWAGIATAAGIAAIVVVIRLLTGAVDVSGLNLKLASGESIDMGNPTTATLTLEDADGSRIVGKDLVALKDKIVWASDREDLATVQANQIGETDRSITAKVQALMPGPVKITASIKDSELVPESENLLVKLSAERINEAQKALKGVDKTWADETVSDSVMLANIQKFEADHGFALDDQSDKDQLAGYKTHLSQAMAAYATAGAVGGDDTPQIKKQWQDYVDTFGIARPKSPEIVVAQKNADDIGMMHMQFPYVEKLDTNIIGKKVIFGYRWYTPETMLNSRGTLRWDLRKDGVQVKTYTTDPTAKRRAVRNWNYQFTGRTAGTHELVAYNPNNDVVWRQDIELE